MNGSSNFATVTFFTVRFQNVPASCERSLKAASLIEEINLKLWYDASKSVSKQLLMATIVYLFVVAYYGIPYLMTRRLPPPSVPSNHA